MPNLTISFKPFAVGLLVIGLGIVLPAQAQLKVGDNPTSVLKSSLLELESSRQGLLLPRLSDTLAIDALNPPNGMLIFLTADGSLRIRSSGTWKRLANMAEANNNWSLSGNASTNPATQFLGTTDAQPLLIKTNNTNRVTIGASGNVGIGVAAPAAKLHVDGSVKMDNLPTGTTEFDVLVIAPGGAVTKRTLSSAAFTNVIKGINGLEKQSITLNASASTAHNTISVANSAVDSTIAIYLPVQDGSAGSSKPYGLLTLADWQKIQDGISTLQTGTVSGTATPQGISISTSGSTRTIVLHPANATNAGVVTAAAQTFGGAKTFQDAVSAAATLKVGGTGTANSSLEVNGSVAMSIRTITANAILGEGDHTVLANTTTAALTVTLPNPSGKAGRIYTIKKIGTGGIDRELTIDPAGATIDGGSNLVIYNDWTFVTLQTDGTNWYIIKK